MSGNTLNRVLIAFALLAMVSCKAKKQLVTNSGNKDTTTVKDPSPALGELNQIRSAQLNFTTFSGKAKTQLYINGSSNNVTLNVRIEKGKRIWVSITAIVGIEVARAEITPDSILVINKLQSLYLKKPFDFIYRYASDKLDYSSVEALLVGNAIPQLLNERTEIKSDSANLDVRGALDNLIYKMVLAPGRKVKTTSLSDESEGQSLDVSNTAFTQFGDRWVPLQIDINSVAASKKVKIGLHYNKVEFDKPLDYPFSIPDGYEPAK